MLHYKYPQSGFGQIIKYAYICGKHLIALHRVSEEVYRFWRTYDDMLMFGDNVLFGSSLSLPTNIRGGLGIFSARATSTRLLQIN